MSDTGKSAQTDKHALEEGSSFSPKFNQQGLIPVICSDSDTGDVLMFAWMNQQALHISIQTGAATYWSRSRAELWTKGKTSGNTQEIVEMRTDCDQDVIWIKVKQHGGAACHTGRRSCFYRKIVPNSPGGDGHQLQFSAAERVFNPKDTYGV